MSERPFFPSHHHNMPAQHGQHQDAASLEAFDSSPSTLLKSAKEGREKEFLQAYPMNKELNDVGLLDQLRASAVMKADIAAHPLFDSLLQAHMQCLNVAGIASCLTQDMAHALEAQFANRHSVVLKYLMLRKGMLGDQSVRITSLGCARNQLDVFMDIYLQHLLTCKNHLDALVLPPTKKALSTLCEVKQALFQLTGASVDDSNELPTSTHFDVELDDVDGGMESQPCDNIDRSLLEHIQSELRLKLKENYKETLISIREEIVRKRQAGTLRGDVSALKEWWSAHYNWPYPTEEEKRNLMKQTGLELRQIQNWFINHRKRNWAMQADHGSSSQQQS